MPTNEQLRQALFELRYWRMRYKEAYGSDEWVHLDEAEEWLRSLWMQLPPTHRFCAEIAEALNA